MRATDGTICPLGIYHDRERLVRVIVVASIIAAVTTAAFLLVRRAAGAFSSDLPAPRLITAAMIALAWGIATRELTARNPLIVSTVIAIILLLALGCSYPGARVIDWLCWPTALFAIVLWPPIFRNRARSPHAPVSQRFDEVKSKVDESTECLLQQLTRIRLADGHEAIRGQLVAEFTAGERQTTLYVAFCPPFERLPHIDVNIADDSDASVKVAQFLHNGTQLEVRLPDPAEEPIRVTIELYATESSK
jgi:hypothetical protein